LKLRASGTRYMKEGREYIKTDKVDIDIRLGKVQLKFEDLFKGDKTLSAVGNELINQNSQTFIDEIRPTIEKNISKKVVTIINQIFEKAPFESFFP